MALALLGTYPLSDQSDTVPAIATQGNLIFLAWKGQGNSDLNIEISNDGGKSFRHKDIITSETTPDLPALASLNGTLYLSWHGNGNALMNVSTVELGPDAANETSVINLTPPHIPGQVGPNSPAIAPHRNLLWMAWQQGSPDNQQIMISYSGDGFASQSTPVAFGSEITDAPIALVSHNDILFIAWKGTGNNLVNVAQVELTTSGNLAVIGPIKKMVPFYQPTSNTGPALASLPGTDANPNGLLHLGWQGTDGHINIATSADNGTTFVEPNISGYEGSAPTMTAFNDRIIVAWQTQGTMYVAHTGADTVSSS